MTKNFWKYKLDLNCICDPKSEGIKIIRRKCNWYEDGEKSSKFFLNLEEDRPIQNQIHC